MKYLLVTGGVISGVGKGIVSSSIGTILRSNGWHVTCIKIDPYLNIDAGTFSPYEHGEVFVLNDGAEVDLDLGNYERFLDIVLHRDNNITTGRVYQKVIEKERRGDYLGKTVQVVPHVTDVIRDWIVDVAKEPVDSTNIEPEICIIELGGTIGEIESMPFVEAFRQMVHQFGHENFCCVHVSLIPQLSSVGEPKTKPTQMSVWNLRNKGLQADILMCRSNTILPASVIEKLSVMCLVKKSHVFSVPDVKSLYMIPNMLEDQHLSELVLKQFNLAPKPPLINPVKPCILDRWKIFVKKYDSGINGSICVSIVGKYTKLKDSYLSIIKALQHSAGELSCKLQIDLIDSEQLEEVNEDDGSKAWMQLTKSDAVVIPGGFGDRGIMGKVLAIRFCREYGIPILGICLGFQCMVIEFMRNIMGHITANSTEFDENCEPAAIIDMPEHCNGDIGGSMRLGNHCSLLQLSENAQNYLTLLNKCFKNEEKLKLFDSIVMSMIKEKKFFARHRHRYEVNPAIIDSIEKEGMAFVAKDAESQRRMEILELFRLLPETPKFIPDCMTNNSVFGQKCKNLTSKRCKTLKHPFFVGVQFHPEYTSRPTKPSPFFMSLVRCAISRLDSINERSASRCSDEIDCQAAKRTRSSDVTIIS